MLYMRTPVNARVGVRCHSLKTFVNIFINFLRVRWRESEEQHETVPPWTSRIIVVGFVWIRWWSDGSVFERISRENGHHPWK